MDGSFHEPAEGALDLPKTETATWPTLRKLDAMSHCLMHMEALNVDLVVMAEELVQLILQDDRFLDRLGTEVCVDLYEQACVLTPMVNNLSTVLNAGQNVVSRIKRIVSNGGLSE